MSARKLHLAVAQLGPVQRSDTRVQVVRRLIDLLEDAHSRGAAWQMEARSENPGSRRRSTPPWIISVSIPRRER